MTTPIVYRPSELPPVYPTCLVDCTFALNIKTLLFAQNSCVWTLNHSFQAVTSSKPIGLVTIPCLFIEFFVCGHCITNYNIK